MTSIYDRTYPSRGRIEFDGGKNNKFERALIADNESPDCANVIFNDGAVETRQGISKLNTTSVGSFICDGLYTRHDNSDSQTMVAWYNGTLYQLAVTTFSTIPSAQSVFTAGQQVYAAEYENYIFFGNGGATPYKYGGDGNTFTRHGIPVPTSAPVLATAATGNILTGDYRYGLTFVNSNLVESDISIISSTLTVAAANISLTSIAVAPQSYGVNARYIYRNAAATPGVYKRVAALNDNTTVVYEDGIADASLGATAPSDNGLPPNYSDIVYHQGRLFVIDPSDNTVKYSEIGNPYVFKSDSFLIVGDNTFDIPIGLEVYDNSIMVVCKVNPWMIYMQDTDPDNWRIVRVKATFGTRSPFGIVGFNNLLMYPAIERDKFVGFTAVSGQTINPTVSLLTSSSVVSDLQSDKIFPDMSLIQSGELDKINAIVFDSKIYIAVTYGAGQTANNRIYVYDYNLTRVKGQEFTWVPFTGISPGFFTIYNNDIYFSSSAATGQVYRLMSGTYADDGVAINSYLCTKEYPGLDGDENIFKDYRYAQLFYEKSGDWYMDFGIRVDSDIGGFDNIQLDLNPGGSLWGTMRWGLDNWGGGSAQGESRIFLSPRRGKRVQFKFSNQNAINQKFKVLGLNFVYNNKGKR